MDKGVIKSEVNLPVIQKNIWSYLKEGLQKYPDMIALECFASGKTYTYAEVLHDSACWARTFSKYRQGKTRPTIALIMSNCIEVPIVALGAARSGCTAQFIRKDFNNEIKKVMLKDSQASIVVSEKVFMDEIKLIEADFPVKSFDTYIYGLDQSDKRSACRVLKEDNPEFEELECIEPNEDSYCCYTSGTTGSPKGIMVSHSSLVNNMDLVKKTMILKNDGKDGKGLTCIISSYIMQLAGIWHSFAIFSAGAKAVLIRPFSLSDTLEASKLYKSGVIFATPESMDNFGNREDAAEIFRNIQVMYNLGESFHPASVNKLKQRFANSNIKIKNCYGSSECGIIALSPRDQERPTLDMKLAPNMEMRIVDVNTGRNLGPNQLGEILIRTPRYFDRYLNNASATSKTFDDQGYYRTGDIGFYTEDLFLTVVERIKDIMVINGVKVFPTELEDIFLLHPCVVGAGIVGMPDGKGGETPHAFIEKMDRDHVSEEDLLRYVNGKVDKEELRVKAVHFVDCLPRADNRKLARKALRELAWTRTS